MNIFAKPRVPLQETLGARGAKCFWNSDCFFSPPWGETAVDTTGAGDAFWGGFISKLILEGVNKPDRLNKAIIAHAMRFGNIAGGLCVQKKGAISSLPTREEIERYLSTENNGVVQ